MSNIQLLTNLPARRKAAAWRYLVALGYEVDPFDGRVYPMGTIRHDSAIVARPA